MKTYFHWAGHFHKYFANKKLCLSFTERKTFTAYYKNSLLYKVFFRFAKT